MRSGLLSRISISTNDDGFEDAPEALNEDGELFQVVVGKDGKVLSVGLAFRSTEKAIAAKKCLTPPTLLEMVT